MKPQLFDIHSHLNFSDFDNDREEAIRRMQENGIWTICVGADRKTSQECVDLAEKYDCIFASVGIHPTDNLETEFPSKLGNSVSKLRELARHPKVVAIGECGIDLKSQKSNLKFQKELFIKQIELALEIDKPLMVHCRDAHEDVLNIVSRFKIQDPRLRGNIHFFSGTWEQAQKYFDLGFTISFAGTLTYDVDYLNDIVNRLPLDKIMIETDAPFAAPNPYRGKRNEPLYVIEIAKKIAEIRRIAYEEIARQTTENALRFFNLF